MSDIDNVMNGIKLLMEEKNINEEIYEKALLIADLANYCRCGGGVVRDVITIPSKIEGDDLIITYITTRMVCNLIAATTDYLYSATNADDIIENIIKTLYGFKSLPFGIKMLYDFIDWKLIESIKEE